MTPDNSATEKPWDVQQHGNLFCVRGPSAIPNCTEESYWHEHEQQAQWLCDALNRAAALHSANEKLRGECERLRAQCARLITNSEIAMVIESEVKRSRYLITGTGQKVGMPKFSIGQVKWLERVFEDQRAMASKADAARAAEGGEDVSP